MRTKSKIKNGGINANSTLAQWGRIMHLGQNMTYAENNTAKTRQNSDFNALYFMFLLPSTKKL